VPREVERRWEGDPTAYGGRRARASFTYRSFIPDPVAAIDPAMSFSTVGLIDDAERAVVALNARANVSGLEAVGPLLLRSEAVASSRIEGIALDVSPRNLARALVDPRAAKGSARDVAANVAAMEEAIDIGARGTALALDDLLALHTTLMQRSLPAHAGRIRIEQNWIGGRLPNPRDAAFVPPPPESVPALIDDLLAFVNRDDLPAVAQAAIAHAQFETIHPFVDGNGRVGRCLIHVVLRRRRVALRFVPPISIVLAAHPRAYVAGLTGFREGHVEAWVASFAEACASAAVLSGELADQVERLQRVWYARAGRPRRDSAAAKIIAALPAQPILSAPTARGLSGASQQMTLEGLKALAAAGILRQISQGSYDRQFAADELFDLVEAYEERIAGRGGAVASASPVDSGTK
jgi:Fic family protein